MVGWPEAMERADKIVMWRGEGSDQIRRARGAERGKSCEDSTIRSVDPTHPHEISALPTQGGPLMPPTPSPPLLET